MTQVIKKPPYKQSVGAQYICFSTQGDDPSEFTKTYTPEVEKTEVVKTVSITEISESTPIYGSGKIYDTDENVSGVEIAVETIAFDATTRAKMRGDTVTEKGFVKKGAVKNGKPFFAYGKVVKMSSNQDVYEWYPKCKLISNTDETKTKEASFSEQNDTYTISAMPYDDDGDICFTYDPSVKSIVGMNEELFFTKPLLDDSDISVTTPEEQPSILDEGV